MSAPESLGAGTGAQSASELGLSVVDDESAAHEALFQALQTPGFSVFECISQLAENGDNVGVAFYLTQRLRQYQRSEVEFYLPQIIQVLLTTESESAALEDLLMEMCMDSTHVMLNVFWHLQAALVDLASQPQSYAFLCAKRLYNKTQFELFAFGDPPSEIIRENMQPALVLSALVMASLVPAAGVSVKSLIVAQGKKVRSHVLRVASRAFNNMTDSHQPDNNSEQDLAAAAAAAYDANNDAMADQSDYVPKSRLAKLRNSSFTMNDLASQSMPDLGARSFSGKPSASYHQAAQRMSGDRSRTTAEKQLKMHYFRCETQFLHSLQSLANKLVQVPKPARLTSLQLELALLDKDLPAEVDIPGIHPPSSGSKQDRIVRISPSEATVLNSAEKAPYLLLVEVLKSDLDFDVSNPSNRAILSTPLSQRRFLFERTYQSLAQSVSRSTSRLHTPNNESAVNSTGVSEVSTPAASSLSAGATATHIPDHERDISELSLADLDDFIDQASGQSENPAGVPLSRREAQAAASAAAAQADAASQLPDIASLAVQMRTANVILSQLDGPQASRLPKADIASLKAKIIDSMQSMQGPNVAATGEAGDRKLENDLKTSGMVSSDDPSAANLGEDWASRKERIRRSSPYGNNPNWDLFSVIVKTGDDLRQEALASQMIQQAQKIWLDAGVEVWVKRMGIQITGSNCGLLETITNGLSVHSIKKALTTANAERARVIGASGAAENQPIAQLSQHFELKFGKPNTPRHKRALDQFVRSLASYSILCYIMQIKDRHNGNILLDNEGHIIHIDFGFMLSNSPGLLGFEAAPFKLTQEYVDLMGGEQSDAYALFVQLLKDSFRALRKHAETFSRMVDLMSRGSQLPCFRNGPATAVQLKQRFQLQLSDEEADQFVERTLLFKSLRSNYTRLYDQFQMVTQGIYN